MTEIRGETWDLRGNRLDRHNALALCYARGFTGRIKLLTAACVMTAESQRYVKAWHVNHEHDKYGNNVPNNDDGGPVILSTDRGLFQINDKWNPEPYPKDMYDPRKNVDAAVEIYRRRGNFSAWAAYNSGRYLLYMPEFLVAYAKHRWEGLVWRWKS